jgi:hypothetical protein
LESSNAPYLHRHILGLRVSSHLWRFERSIPQVRILETSNSSSLIFGEFRRSVPQDYLSCRSFEQLFKFGNLRAMREGKRGYHEDVHRSSCTTIAVCHFCRGRSLPIRYMRRSYHNLFS